MPTFMTLEAQRFLRSQHVEEYIHDLEKLEVRVLSDMRELQ